MMRFRDREDAGRRLGSKLSAYKGEETIVLALPRGGVPVGYEVARALGAPLDVCIVRKIGVPWHPELGVGAVAEGGFVPLSPEVLEYVGLSEGELSELILAKQREVAERVRTFRRGHSRVLPKDRTVILVDDGIATGGTVRAAIHALRADNPRRIVLAVPVASPSAVAELSSEVDDLICLMEPQDLHAIGLWYEDFSQIPDDEVIRILEQARRHHPGAGHVSA